MWFFSVGLAAITLASWWLTGRVREYALRSSLLDVPNQRSSHAQPTPRGGGLAFALMVLTLLPLVAIALPQAFTLCVALGGGGALIVAVGWADDRFDIAPIPRAVTHTVAAMWAVARLGGMPSLELGVESLPLGIAGSALAVLLVVWSTNLFNFMDGIDGIAGSQAVLVCAVGACLAFAVGDVSTAAVASIIAAAVVGFLLWNWPPAKVFMGDCGSGLLGFAIAVLALSTEISGTVPLGAWAVLMTLFWVDATATLSRRMLCGERWYAAHCSHAYQRATQAGASHGRVTAAFVALNVPIACAATVVVMQPRWLLPIFATTTAAAIALWLVTLQITARRIRAIERLEEVRPAEAA